jgi:hypothetical protein
MMWSLYRRVGDEPINEYEDQSLREVNQHKMDTMIFPQGSRACWHATSPLCRPPLCGLAANWQSKPSSPRAPQEPTVSDVSQWHKKFIRVVFTIPPRKAQHPSQITGRWPRTITTLAITSPLPPSHLGGDNHQDQERSLGASHHVFISPSNR